MLNIDRLINRIDELRNPSVVGLDPSLSMMPDSLARAMYSAHGRTPLAVSEMFFLYNKAIIDAVVDVVPAVKPQIAMYEMYGADGVAAYIRTCEYAANRGMYVIGDIKRGDISSTAEAYAAHLSGAEIEISDGAPRVDIWREDAITVNPYLGADGIEPFTKACRKTGKSLFVLVKTSNRSSAELQDVMTEAVSADLTSAGESAKAVTVPNDRGARLYERVADYVDIWGEGLIGERGYSAVGAVVGATHPEVGRALREAHPQMFFLVPGYGAQGARAADIAGYFDAEGRGCVVNSSRGVIAAWRRLAPDAALRADSSEISSTASPDASSAVSPDASSAVSPDASSAASPDASSTASPDASSDISSADSSEISSTASSDAEKALSLVASAARAAALAMATDLRDAISGV
jgi:orotidine-5'-phosphate decarboxylase